MRLLDILKQILLISCY